MCLEQWIYASATPASTHRSGRRTPTLARSSRSGGKVEPAQQLLVRYDPGCAVDVQPDPVEEEVEEQEPHVGVLADVAQAGHHPVAAVLRVEEVLLVQRVDESRLAGPEAHVALAAAVGGGEEKHVLAGDEVASSR